jgi:SPP1 family predicted phage head-tail adaptor
MTIGQLRHRVQLQAEVLTPDGYGGAAKTWDTVDTVAASVEPLSGREFFQAQQTQSSVSHKITIRHRADTTSSLRILFGTRVFDISSVLNPDERNRWMVLMATERRT